MKRAGRLPSARSCSLILLKFEVIHQVAGQIIGIAGSGDLDFREHLAGNYLEMFVVDVLALRTVNFLYFRQQVQLAGMTSLDAQDQMRIQGAFGQGLSSSDIITFLYQKAGSAGDFVFRFLMIFVGND